MSIEGFKLFHRPSLKYYHQRIHQRLQLIFQVLRNNLKNLPRHSQFYGFILHIIMNQKLSHIL